jgi:transposase
MNNPAAPLAMTDGQRKTLQSIARSQTAPHRLVTRSQALLLAADGVANTRIAKQVNAAVPTIRAWRARFEAEGIREFGKVAAGRGRKPKISDDQVAEIVRLTQNGHPEGHTHWSCRTMAKATGVSSASVQRIWSSRGLKPHRVHTFKISSDPKFDEKLIDVVGLYLNPPDQAVVLCMDEKSSVQALDRTQPSLPMKKGRAGTMTHDYKRNGTTTLFAALDVLSGNVIGECLPRHRHEEFLKFLRRIDREVPKGLAVHMILDNYATHKHPDVKTWLSKHPRFHLHFTPTSSSWLNLVERWFREITDKAIRRGVFPSVPDLISAIEAYMRANNANPKPFVWTATADAILAKVRRGRIALKQLAS